MKRPDGFTIKSPQTAEEFEKYYLFRWELLRAPWKQPRGTEKDAFENISYHLMVCDKTEHIIAIGRIHTLDNERAQIRYMAVEEQHRHNGLGRLVLQSLEQEARQWRCDTIFLNARKPAVPFYEKQGYVIKGNAHTLYGVIEHLSMQKDLT